MSRGKYLITGGSGFLGSYVTKLFRNFENWDVKEGRNLFGEDEIPEGTNAIIHLVAQLEILDVNPKTELVMNVESTIHMLELCRKFDVPKFIFASTADVYGEPFANKGISYIRLSKENDAPKPFWSYAASKVAAEAYVRQYEELYGIKTVIIRPSIITGIEEWYGRFITLSMARIRMEQPILVFGNGLQTRDFVDVSDVAYLFARATVDNVKTPITLNAGSGKPKRIKDVAKLLKRISKAEIRYINPKVGELGRKPHEQINQGLDMDRVKQLFNWTPSIPFVTTLMNEFKWTQFMSDEEFEIWVKRPRY